MLQRHKHVHVTLSIASSNFNVVLMVYQQQGNSVTGFNPGGYGDSNTDCSFNQAGCLPLFDGDIGCGVEVKFFGMENRLVCFSLKLNKSTVWSSRVETLLLYGGSCRSAQCWVQSPPLWPCHFGFVFMHAHFFIWVRLSQ